MPMLYTVYKMLDPRTMQVRYIGMTSQPIMARLWDHCTVPQRGHSDAMDVWLLELKAIPMRPSMVAIIAVENGSTATVLERGMIYFYRTVLKANLFNKIEYPGAKVHYAFNYLHPGTEAEALAALLDVKGFVT